MSEADNLLDPYYSNLKAVIKAQTVDGWQGPGSDGTKPKCFDAAMRIAELLDARDLPIAFVSPSPAGGLGFYWHPDVGDVSLEIELEDDELDFYVSRDRTPNTDHWFSLTIDQAYTDAAICLLNLPVSPRRTDGDGPCYYCGDETNSLAGSPSSWPVYLCHVDKPGVVRHHHVGCVSRRLAKLEELENAT